MTMTCIRLTLPLAVALLPACTPTPDEVPPVISESESGASSSSGPGPTTTPPTTLTGEETVGTQSGTGTDTTMGVVDDTSGTTADETTMGVEPTTTGSSGEESSSGEPPQCTMPGDCPNNQTCNEMGECVSVCGAWGAGTYGGCLNGLGGLDTGNVCGADHICIADPSPYEVTVCSAQTCAINCDCPPPPATGNAVVTCGSITFGDSDNDCYLSCANNETCPDGMECLNDGSGDPLLCAVSVPTTVPMYGNCEDLVTSCDGGACGVIGVDMICTEGCSVGVDCELAPPGAFDPECGDVFDPPGGNDCYLPCFFNPGHCPQGMSCVDIPGTGGACMW
jgi:hypothetical protein